MGIEYEGSGFQGWQRLTHAPSVQGVVEEALSFVADHNVLVTCSGRTDSGVHALAQVIHLDVDSNRTEYSLRQGANSRLPETVSALWCQQVPDEFNARFSARARRYRYRILNRRVRPAFMHNYLSWERAPLDAEAMHRGAQFLLGEHDFSSFRSSQCQAHHPRREVQAIRVWREDDVVTMEIQANAFLHHMVRNIIGSLVPIGLGEQPERWMGEVLAAHDRTAAGPTAAPDGLIFLGPLYPAEWKLPEFVTLSTPDCA